MAEHNRNITGTRRNITHLLILAEVPLATEFDLGAGSIEATRQSYGAPIGIQT